jgi:hypothetical protein
MHVSVGATLGRRGFHPFVGVVSGWKTYYGSIPSRKITNSSSPFSMVANWQPLALSDLARRDCERQALDDVTP